MNVWNNKAERVGEEKLERSIGNVKTKLWKNLWKTKNMKAFYYPELSGRTVVWCKK